MHRANRPSIIQLNQQITCRLCKGYFIDATTINECLHTFCRSCIVKYLEKNKYCPVCDVQVHKTKPLLNIRPDKTIQNIVYKLVPRLYQNEIHRRKVFYDNHPESKSASSDFYTDGSYQHLLTPEETVYITLSYYGCDAMTRYLRCPAAVSVAHLKKLIQAKYDLNDNHRVDILYNQDCLISSLTLMDISYIYNWKKKVPLELCYKIYECTSKKVKLDDEQSQTNNNNWKEVQLRISENGEMSITGIQDSNTVVNIVNSDKYKSEIVTVVESKSNNNNNNNNNNNKREMPGLKLISKTTDKTPTTSCNDVIVCESIIKNNSDLVQISTASSASLSSSSTTTTTTATTKTVFSTINSTKCSTTTENLTKNNQVQNCNDKGVKRKLDEPVLSLVNLSNNHPLKKHSKLNRNGEIVEKDEFLPKTNYNPVINVPKPTTSFKIETTTTTSGTTTQSDIIKTTKCETNSVSKTIKTKANSPIGYKTLREPPKSWNSQIAKANLINKPINSSADLKSIRPKFFKGRNMPRYLGNPASGVKPMYQVTSPEKPQPDKSEIKKHSIVKIDPKTLKPISEKAPETASLSSQSDLKINTSSVSIFNPLKLQSCSPKNERKSPKSPHSPKMAISTIATATTSTTTTTKSISPTSKRDKINLNFTPPNPFIPNLTSPTLNPNQFLYPSGPAGFPSYDPRFMVAYQSLWYSQRMGFPTPPAHPPPLPNINLDLNHQRKGFELMPPPTSPKLTQTSTISTKALTSTSKTIIPVVAKSSSIVKKSKDLNKNEKSLENTVEKLTQNRVKENLNKNELKTKETSDETATVKENSTTNNENKVECTKKDENNDSNKVEPVEMVGETVKAVIEEKKEVENLKEEPKVVEKLSEKEKVSIETTDIEIKVKTDDKSDKLEANHEISPHKNVEETVGTNSSNKINNNTNSADVVAEVAGAK